MSNETRKGFVLIEAMVVLAFLATTLLNIYTSFNNVLDRTKKRLYYDDPVYLYRTYYLLDYLERNGITRYIDVKFYNTSGSRLPDGSITYLVPDILEFGCRANFVDGSNAANNDIVNNVSATSPMFCENIKSSFEIDHIYIMKYDVNSVVSCVLDMTQNVCKRNSALRTFSNTAVDYLYTLDGYTTGVALAASTQKNYDNGYRLVVEFRHNSDTTYTYKTSPTSAPKTTVVTKSDYYYTTLEIPYGKDQSSSSSGYHTEI